MQIAQRDYGFGKTKNKTLTRATYNAIGDHFRTLWGDEAGWAHSVCAACSLPASSDGSRPVGNDAGNTKHFLQVLFTADLRTFSERLVKTETKRSAKKAKLEAGVVELEEPAEVKTRSLKRVKVEDEVLSSLAERVKRRRR